MRATVLAPVGVLVREQPVQLCDDTAIETLRDLLAEHGVLVLAGQQVDDADFLRFLGRFGRLVPSVGEIPVTGYPDLNVISNVGRSTPPKSTFHVDTSYVRRPPEYTSLRAVTIPAAGGQTVFSNQYLAYETLDPAVREQLEGRSIEHVVSGVELGAEDETAAWHPIVRRHPRSGRVSLYLTTPGRCARVSDLSEADARELVDLLHAHSTREEHTYRHTWQAGDIVMWDNGCVMHQADHSGVVGDRVMHRGMVAAGETGA